MGFIDNQCIVGQQVPVPDCFRQQDAVGHDFNERFSRAFLFKTDFVSNRLAALLAQFRGNALGNADGRDAPGLGQADHAPQTQTCGKAHFGNLGCFSRSGFAGNNGDLMFLNAFNNLSLFGDDRQVLRKFYSGSILLPFMITGGGKVHYSFQLV